MASEIRVRGALPRVQWAPVIAGTLCAIAAHIVLGLFGAAFGFAAEPADSGGVGFAAGIWALLVPFFASLIGAYVCVRIARETDTAGAFLHGALVWCIGLVAGAVFLTGTLASSAMSSATAASGNARAFVAGRDLRGPQAGIRNEARQDAAAKAAAAASGAAGLGALLGLCGALLGAAAGRRELTGEGMRFGRGFRRPAEGAGHAGYREEMGTTGGTHAGSGVVARTTTPGMASTTRPEARPGEMPAPDDPTMHH